MKKIVLGFFVTFCFLVLGCAGSLSSVDKDGLYISSWYANYDAGRGYQSFSDNVRLFNEINPVWYNLNPAYFSAGASPFEGNLLNHAAILSLAGNNGVKVLPTIQNFGATSFDPKVIDSIIHDPTARSRHIAGIVSLVLTNNYDGIDIDYESLSAANQSDFSAFISELGVALHRQQKLLSVTVYAKTSADASWDGPGAEDWQSLAIYADSLKVMAYDYHWASFHAGPISPIDWLQDILNYARTIPAAKGKIIIGLPLYGLDWGGGNSAKEAMYDDALGIIDRYALQNYSRRIIRHSDPMCSSYWSNVEMHFEYSNAGISHMVYFQDKEAARQRLTLINQYRDVVKGIAFWRLGGEDPGTWREISNYK